MPTETKRRIVAELADQIARATLAIATDFSGLGVNELTELRRRLRARSAEYRVVKNRLVVLAAKEAGKDGFVELVEGSTGIVFGYGEAVDAAKALDEFIRSTRSQLVVRNGILDGAPLSRGQITALAGLPPKEELLARLLGQLQTPVARLVNVLNGPLQGLAIVLQRRAEQMAGPEAPETDEPEAPEADEPGASETDEPEAPEEPEGPEKDGTK